MRQTYIAGVGMTPFGKFPDERLGTLGAAAALRALADAGISPKDVEVLSCGSARSGVLQGRESGVGQLIGWEVGIEGVPVFNEKAYCASGTVAFNVAFTAVLSGQFDVALAVGVEQMSRRNGKGAPLTSDGMELEGDIGFSPAVYYALAAQRHMAEYGTTREQIASVAVKNRAFAAHNPVAQYRAPITVADVLASKPVVGPLNLLDCCPTGDGAAAAVIVSDAGARRLGITPTVRVRASVVGSGVYSTQAAASLSSFELDVRTARRAYEMASLGPQDVDVAEVHDSFSIAEIIHYEDLGFCERGQGGKFVESGQSSLGGRLPVSTSGGLLTRGHPLGATGLAQLVELADQLRGRCGPRQVEGASIALAQISGGFHLGSFASSGVTILEGSGR
ncbi:thiolase family protein [Dactylosporangium sp. NPDC051485]|uniref:thiolase family protein n=1 Tax=Dactylosporangium sp. NPDC051485 TaxID=3154846 RepID=UPI003422A264